MPLLARGFKLTSIVYQQFPMFSAILDGPCRIRIGRDREGIIYIVIAKQSTPAENWAQWFTLDLLIYFLSNHTVFIGQYFNESNFQEQQMERLIGHLLSYLDKINDLFLSAEFEQANVTLKNLRPVIDQLRYDEYVAHNKH